MNDVRIWLPGQSIHHAAFRMLRIMAMNKTDMDLEKLYILDFLLAYPSVLHDVHIPRTMKTEFTAMHTQKPDAFFLSLPSRGSLFRDMDVMQAEAVKSLVGKSIFDKELYLKKIISLDPNKIPKELLGQVNERNKDEHKFIIFLVSLYGGRSLEELRDSTNLKRKIY